MKIFSEWEASAKGQKAAITGPLLVKTGTNVVVNFDTSVGNLFKEITELRDLGYSPSFDLVLLATKGNNSISLHDILEKTVVKYNEATTLRRYVRASCILQFRTEYDCLLDSTRKETEGALEQGLNLIWDRSPNLESYVQDLSHKVDDFLQKSRTAHCYYSNLVSRLAELETCTFRFDDFSAKLADLQTLSRESLSAFLGDATAVEDWLCKLNAMIGEILLRRLLVAIQLWTQTISQPNK